MKTLYVILVAIMVCGCKMPSMKFGKAQQKVQEVKESARTNQEALDRKAANYTFAADYSLSLDPSPTVWTTTAQEMTQRSLLASGLPSVEDALSLRKMIKELVSTNEALKAKGIKDLAAKDTEVVAIQKKADVLQTKLEKVENEKDKIAEANSLLADKWKRFTGFFWKIAWVVGLIIAFRLACVFVPALMPVGGILDFAAGSVGKMVFRALPAAQHAAGVVSQEVHEVSEATLHKVVAAVQDFRVSRQAVNPNDPALAEFNAHLEKHTENDVSRPKIREVKENLNLA